MSNNVLKTTEELRFCAILVVSSDITAANICLKDTAKAWHNTWSRSRER